MVSNPDNHNYSSVGMNCHQKIQSLHKIHNNTLHIVNPLKHSHAREPSRSNQPNIFLSKRTNTYPIQTRQISAPVAFYFEYYHPNPNTQVNNVGRDGECLDMRIAGGVVCERAKRKIVGVLLVIQIRPNYNVRGLSYVQ